MKTPYGSLDKYSLTDGEGKLWRQSSHPRYSHLGSSEPRWFTSPPMEAYIPGYRDEHLWQCGCCKAVAANLWRLMAHEVVVHINHPKQARYTEFLRLDNKFVRYSA